MKKNIMKKHKFYKQIRISAVCFLTLALNFSSWASEVILCGSTSSIPEPEPVETTKDNTPASLGMFTTTGYCNCEACSGGHSLTYAGTVPQANHTISADLELFPLGTKLMIGDVIYTVEDMGSSVSGNKVDIYYDNHESAVAHGMQTQEVFFVIP